MWPRGEWNYLNCLIIYFQLLLTTSCIYSSLEFTKLFWHYHVLIWSSNTFMRQASQWLLFFFAEKETGRASALPKATGPKRQNWPRAQIFPNIDLSAPRVHSHFQRLQRERPVSFLFQEWIWQKNKTVQLILAAAARKLVMPSCWIWRSVEERQRKLPFAFHFGSCFDFIERKEMKLTFPSLSRYAMTFEN